MAMFNRLALMKAHVILAAFVLPAAILFLVTGALYTWGVKGAYDTTAYELSLDAPLQADLPTLVSLAAAELQKRNLEVPSGEAKIKRAGISFKLEWTGSRMDVVIEPTTQPLVARLKIKRTSLHRQFVQLHKAKGGIPFKVYAALFSAALLLLLITGFVMAWQTPILRKQTAVSASLGIVVFVVMVAFS